MTDTKQDSQTESDRVVSLKRRSFLGTAGVAAAIGVVGVRPALADNKAQIGFTPRPGSNARGDLCYQKRVDRAHTNMFALVPDSVSNGDEMGIANFAAAYSKGLPHNAIGEVQPSAYIALQRACVTNNAAEWDAVQMGGSVKLVNPQSANSFQMEGADPSRLRAPAPAHFSSEQRAAEMAELYWMALLRDVPFAEYASNETAAAAVADLGRFNLFADISAQTLFRGVTSGHRNGPYLSQFLLKNVPYGPATMVQKYAAGAAGVDYATTLTDCLGLQNGQVPSQPAGALGEPHYILDGRGLAAFVHNDFPSQVYLNAALMLLSMGNAALDDGNPYQGFSNRAAFCTFGGPDILSTVSHISALALKAAWHQKWSVHRILRPEAFGLRVHQDLAGVKSYPINSALLNSTVLDRTLAKNGSLLLSQAYVEGSPSHPSYPSGHATVAGACVTVLKAFFKESFVLSNSVIPSADGSSLQAYEGAALTVGGELEKLGSNIANGRNIAGVHYWSDAVEGMRLGEQVAIAYLQDLRSTYTESFSGFSLTRFDGSQANI